jgi:hypothetical protein
MDTGLQLQVKHQHLLENTNRCIDLLLIHSYFTSRKEPQNNIAFRKIYLHVSFHWRLTCVLPMFYKLLQCFRNTVG